MNKALTLFTLIVTAIVVSGCSSLKPPVRPDYTGTDQVTMAKPAQLLGTWTVIDLNPYPESDPQSVTIEYKQDGSVHGLIIPQGESAAALGYMKFNLTGFWQLDGDTINHTKLEMESAGDNNQLGSFISKMVSKHQSVSGQANIFEISESRIVMVGRDGNAMEYTRQK